MADYTITARIIIEASEAIKETEKLKKEMAETASKVTNAAGEGGSKWDRFKDTIRGFADDMGLVTKKNEIDVRKLTASFAMLGATAGAALTAIIAASPSMTVAMMEMQFALREVALVIGEDLAPIINDYLVPVMEGFRDFIMSLNPEVRQWIGLTILLTTAISALALAVAALSAVSLPLIAIVVAIAAAIAAIIIVWRNWNAIIEWARENTELFIGILFVLTAIFGPFVVSILAIIAVIKNWGNITTWLQNMWGNFVDFFSGMIDFIADKWNSFWDTVGEGVSGINTIITTTIESAVEGIRGVLNAIIDWINTNVIAFINNRIITSINSLLPEKHALGDVADIPSAAVGISYVPRNMPIKVHEGERILTAEENKAYNRNRRGGGDTYQFNNTFKIGSVMDRQTIRMLASEVETIQARQARRRGNR